MLRVDKIPWYMIPFFLLFGYGIGVFFFVYIWLMHLTCRIQFTGTNPALNSSAVYCIWHESLVLYFIAFPKVSKQVWMNHPAWYMKPVHVLLRLTGVEHICLGSSGNSGKLALQHVIEYLLKGYSTTVACDGPAGPPKELKPGVLLMSRDAKVPVIPLRFSCSRSFRIGGWDRKIIPGLFSEITVHIGPDTQIMSNSPYEVSKASIINHLNGELSPIEL